METGDTHTTVDPQTLTLVSIAFRCGEETKRFMARQAATFEFCYELFRRAIQQRDVQAWELIMQQYQRLMQSWASRHSRFASTGEEADYFVNGACAKLWERITPERFSNFPDVKSILRYLQMCVHSAVTDYARQHGVVTVEFGESELKEERIAIVADNTSVNAERQQFWAAINTRLKDDKERLVIRGLFVYGFKPAELFSKHPNRFRDVKEIYSIRENVMDRLARDTSLKELKMEN